MKPTSPISSQTNDGRNFPLTDYQFQTTLEAPRATATETRHAIELRMPWKLSAEFFGAEAHRYYFSELALFTLITGVSAWPIVSMLVAVTRMVRNY